MAITAENKICIACQECCKWLTFQVQIPDQLIKDYIKVYNSRGCRVHSIGNNALAVMVPSICPQLTSFGCKIYRDRPKLCRLYDGRKDSLMRDFCKLPTKENYNGKK